ncbi:CBS domain-containing protein [Candidatus Nitrosotalea bavarica]|uniref:CBS domain-containing protein n=1 Tax=Candidatus Nitrosotalea bavarica TaxID=1903277 RepID=UPI001FE4CF52|nr:CBS domain-containing protein [Candidatus Nitrosotalea bavarica]
MDNFSAKDIMKNQVVTVDAAISVMDTAKIMDDAGIGCVVVIENNIAVGIVTERDFVKRVVSRGIPLTTPIKKIMSSPLIVVNPEENIWEVAELMKQRRIHKVPVVHQDLLVGIVTATDLTKLCSIGSDSEMRRITDQILLRMKPADK